MCLKSSLDDDEFWPQPNSDASLAVLCLLLAGNFLRRCLSENALIFHPMLESLTKRKILGWKPFSHTISKTMVRVFLHPGLLLRNPCPLWFLVLFIWLLALPTLFRSFPDFSLCSQSSEMSQFQVCRVFILCERHSEHPFKLEIHICSFVFLVWGNSLYFFGDFLLYFLSQ